MFWRKSDVIVGLTTFNTGMLKISVPALSRIKSRFTLIIHNDNPNVRLRRRDIRAMGYHGKLHVINSDKNVGLRLGRIRILDTARRCARDANWIIYVDDDDVLLNIGVPSVSDDVFAVIQNALIINASVADLMTGATYPDALQPNDSDIVMQRPHLGLRGTMIRIKHMVELADIINDDVDAKLRAIDDSLEYRPPIDRIMWAALNTLMRKRHPECAPIFMDSVNYIQNNIDFGAMKYGRPGMMDKNHGARLANALARYDRVIQGAIAEQ